MNLLSNSLINCIGSPNNYISICISNKGNVYSFGYSIYGSHANKENYIFPPKQINNLINIISISSGYFHTLCLDDNSNVYSFGFNSNGQLGIKKFFRKLKNTYCPLKINLPPVKTICAAACFSICLCDNGNVYSFGDNKDGQLGLAHYNNVYSPQRIPNLSNVNSIVCGRNYVICRIDNKYYSWGDNYYGQLGNGSYESCNKPIQCINWPNNIIDIKCSLNHTLLLTINGYIYSFGDNNYAQLGINNKNIKSINTPTLIKDIPEIQRIECGYYHSMCIDINNNLWIFGDNYYGQLGLGDTEDRYKPILHPTLSNIIDISSGGYHTFVKTIDNKIYAFGDNNHSQLGIKTLQSKQIKPIQVFRNKESIWKSKIIKSRIKSARK